LNFSDQVAAIVVIIVVESEYRLRSLEGDELGRETKGPTFFNTSLREAEFGNLPCHAFIPKSIF
jgi:hypothetical protein